MDFDCIDSFDLFLIRTRFQSKRNAANVLLNDIRGMINKFRQNYHNF